MEDKDRSPMSQEEFEKLSRSYAEQINGHKSRGFGIIPEGLRRVSRFGIYSLRKHLPTDSYNKHFSKAYLPFSARNHGTSLMLSLAFVMYLVIEKPMFLELEDDEKNKKIEAFNNANR